MLSAASFGNYQCIVHSGHTGPVFSIIPYTDIVGIRRNGSILPIYNLVNLVSVSWAIVDMPGANSYDNCYSLPWRFCLRFRSSIAII